MMDGYQDEGPEDLQGPPGRRGRAGPRPRRPRVPGRGQAAGGFAGADGQRRSDRGDQEATEGGDPGPGGTKKRPSWWPDWQGQVCVIVASGPSARDIPLDLARGRVHTIAINESWRLCRWADILYGCDGAWWRARAGVPEFRGLKLSQDREACVAFPDIHKIELSRGESRILTDQAGFVGWGGNSGFHALNLAVQFGCRRIILVGYDMRVDRGLHWHGKHGGCLNNPTAGRMMAWRKLLDAAASDISEMGVEVLNASPVSALTAYPVVDFADAIVREFAPC